MEQIDEILEEVDTDRAAARAAAATGMLKKRPAAAAAAATDAPTARLSRKDRAELERNLPEWGPARERALKELREKGLLDEEPPGFWYQFGLFAFLIGSLVFAYTRYQWAFTELPKMSGAKNKAALQELLQEPVAGIDLAGQLGNSDCWDGDFTYARCCDLTKGASGDKLCWRGEGEFGYNDCCDVADRVKKSRHIMKQGEQYFHSARWLWFNKAKKRHFKDALLLFQTASKFDALGNELGFMIQHVERAIESFDPKAPPPPRRSTGPEPEPEPSRPYRPPHEVLGVAKQATEAEILLAYKGLSRKHHPDRGGDEQLFMEIADARDKMLATLDEF